MCNKRLAFGLFFKTKQEHMCSLRERKMNMQYQEFKEWLEQNTRGYELFLNKAMELQLARNKKRTGKTKKWTDSKMERAAESMWVDVVKNAYEQIKGQKGAPKYNGYQIWVDFLAEIDFVENFDDSMAGLEFE